MSSDRIAIITGAAQGIGRATALRLASDGLDIMVNDLPTNTGLLDTLVQEIQAKGRKALAVTGDISSEPEVQNLIDVTVKEFGGLDVMIANAGEHGENVRVENDAIQANMVALCKSAGIIDTPVEAWDKLFAVNARGTFLCYKAAAAQLIKQGRGGRIIGACSGAGKSAPKDLVAYASTKFAIRGLTQSVAQELGRYGITVNAYAPGPIDTLFLAAADAEFCEREGLPVGSQKKAIAEASPYGKLGTPEDIAGLVSYIVSPESKYITGQCLNINGGLIFD